MVKYKPIFLISILIFLAQSYIICAEEYTFFSLQENKKVSADLIYIEMEDVIYKEHIQRKHTVSLEPTVQNSEKTVTLILDNLTTPGLDYVTTVVFSEELNGTLYFLSSGSLRGIVTDQNANLVSNAKLKFECTHFESFTSFPKETDEFGSFFIEVVPIGDCKILATSKNTAGYVLVHINRGEMIDTEVRLNTLVNKKSSLLSLLMISGMGMGIIVFTLMLLFKRSEKKKLEPKKQELGVTHQWSVMPKRMEHILKTLSEKERALIHLLYGLPNKSENQAHIRHQLQIPRTTLSRMLQGLERKKIVTITKYGKLITVSLTPWILEKEE